MKTPLEPNERILKEGPANMQRGLETAGGKLFLTNRRLIFEAHTFNLQRGTTVIAVNEVHAVEKCWTQFLNFIPLAPNSLAIITFEGAEFKFVLNGRALWASAITNAKNALAASL